MSLVQEIRQSLITRSTEYRAQMTQKPGILRQYNDYIAMREKLVPDMLPQHRAMDNLAGYGEIAKRAPISFFNFDKTIVDQYIRASRQRAHQALEHRRVEEVKEYRR